MLADVNKAFLCRATHWHVYMKFLLECEMAKVLCTGRLKKRCVEPRAESVNKTAQSCDVSATRRPSLKDVQHRTMICRERGEVFGPGRYVTQLQELH